MSRTAARPDRTIRLWQRAFSRGYAGVLCDAIAAQRPVPARLYAALYRQPRPGRRRGPPPARPPAPRPAVVDLSGRQTEILLLASHGLRDPAIAARLRCSRNAVSYQWGVIFDRMGVRGPGDPRTRAVARGIRSGML